MEVYCALFLVFVSGITSSCSAITTSYDVYTEEACQLLGADHHTECLTLWDVLSERDKYFTSNSTLIFHDGDHILQGEVVSVSNISNFTLQGFSGSGSSLPSPMITCINSSFSFSGVSIVIESIKFNYCSISLWQATAVVQDSRFENGRAVDGGALAVHSSSVHFVGANTFSGNMAESKSGAIYADRSNLTFSGSTVFTDNKALYGGAVYCSEGNILSFDGVSIFMNNTAEHGGAVYALIANTLSFNGCSSRRNISAIMPGGTVCSNNMSFSDDSTLSTCSFLNNSASWHGGAVAAWHSNTLSFSGNCSFMSNTAGYGGAISASTNNTLSFNGKSTSFMDNAAEYNGGAVNAGNTNIMTFSRNSSFTGNTADSRGGAVFAWIMNTFSFSGNSSFMSNMADYGGAVSTNTNNTLSFNGKYGSTRFMNNAAGTGGAVIAGNKNVLTFSGNSSFMGNMAHTRGGAVYAWITNTLSFSGNSSFMNNSADYGGAVSANNNNTLSFNEHSSFVNNFVAWHGGAVAAWLHNTLGFSGNSRFKSNTAKYGGAVSARYANTMNFSGRSSFMENAAEFGGAVNAGATNTLSFNGNSSFMSNTAEYGGAVGANTNNSLIFNGNSSTMCSFMNNTAYDEGGAVYVGNTNALSFSRNSSFMGNTAEHGGAVSANTNNSLSFNGNSSTNFMNNAAVEGGAVYAGNTNVWTFSGNSSFMGNTADAFGGAVHAWITNILSFSGNSRFTANTAGGGGAVLAALGNILIFNGTSGFMNNAASIVGGAVSAVGADILIFSGNTTFMSNTAHYYGGAVHGGGVETLIFSGESSFINNTAEYGGAVYGEHETTVSFSGKSVLEDNEAVRGGGIALFWISTVRFSETVSLSFNIARFGGGAFVQESIFESFGNIDITVAGNEATHGGGLFLQSSTIKLQSGGFVENVAVNNELEGGHGGAILARSSKVHFQRSVYFGNNSADFGGGLALFGVSDGVFLIKHGAELSFEGNLAHRRGGAIFVKDDAFTFCPFDTVSRIDEPCYFQVLENQTNCFPGFRRLQVNDSQLALKFHNNTAKESGNIMYGGFLESCVVCGNTSLSYYGFGLEVFHTISEYHGPDGYSNMSSDPYKVCICEGNVPNCDQRQVNVTVYPGQVLVTSVVAVGQMNGTVPSVIRAVSDDLITNSDFKETQPAENDQECSQLRYPLLSRLPQASLKLYSDEPCSIFGYPLTYQINFLPCPVGFTFSDQGTCICDERLQKYTQNCSIPTLTISRLQGDSFWVGVEEAEKLILHPHCPFDYCIEESTDIPLNSTTKYNSTDMQCANGRSGILCGACQPGRSLALGSSRCLSDCSNCYLALLLVFAFAGVVLVAFLFLCHLTVAEGTLNGLIFYANVLAVNQTVFFPSGERNLLTVFIAWLNLDLGIETCFFESLDTYYSTWLQFAFPIYIWATVGAIIVLADRSVLVAKIIGSANPVAVLATLFLLSYTKLLRAIMTAFAFTTLDYPDGDSKYVWLYDGNLGYLDRHTGRHIGLFFFSLLFLLFVFLPYTLLLLCGQWTQRKVWWLSPTKQLYFKSFLDAYYGPYKDRHRYWIGLLLLLRFIMLSVETVINIRNPQDPFSNLLVIQVVCLVACCWDTVTRGLYKKWYLDLLEISFFVNLNVLVGGTYQVRQSGGNQAALVYTSVGVVFMTFIGIVSSAMVKRVKAKIAQYRRRASHQVTNTVPDKDEDPIRLQLEAGAAPPLGVTYSVLEIIRNHPDQTSGEIELQPTTGESLDSSK